MSILGGAGANAAPLWAMPYEDAAPLFATGVRVCVIVYYYDEVEKQILPAFGHTLRRATAPEAKAAGSRQRMRGG